MPTAHTGWRGAANGRGFGVPTTYPALLGPQLPPLADAAAAAATPADLPADDGCLLPGAAAPLSEALASVEATTEIDAAILDVNLGGQKVFPVADILVARDVPIVFSTAYGPADLKDRYPRARIIQKPYRPEALAELLIDLAQNRRG